MEHRISRQTGKEAPHFTWHQQPFKFANELNAQNVIDSKGMKHCRIVEKGAIP